MTGQTPDIFIFKGERYELIGMEGHKLISPEQFGMYPVMLDTGCYRGFYCTYELTDTVLYLRRMTLREGGENYLPINGILPEKEKYQTTYHNLSVEVPFTGKLRLAKDLIPGLYIHMGYQKPTAFKTVYDVTLADGKVVDIKDRSEEMEKKRGAFKKHYKSGNMIQTIEDAFSLDMDLE